MPPILRPVLRSVHRPLIEVAARQWAWDPDLLEAQIFVESSDDPQAFRFEPDFYRRYLKGKPEWLVWGPLAACSYGLLQIMGAVAVELGFAGTPYDLFVPATNLFWAGKKLASLRDQCGGDVRATLASYNGGVGGNLVPPFRNGGYVTKVLRQFQQITGGEDLRA